MKDQKLEDNVFKITHSVELLVWLIVILVVVFICSFLSIWRQSNDENDYQIFMQDVDGLIVGSSVRMMGVEVGHVVKIKPTNNEVYVNFVLTNPDVYIPQGTRATVEFSGLAGSKSLELYLPEKGDYIDGTTPILVVMPPKRLHDALGLLNDMFDKIASIAYTTSSFSSKLGMESVTKDSISDVGENVKDFLEYADIFLEDSNEKAQSLRKSILGSTKYGK